MSDPREFGGTWIGRSEILDLLDHGETEIVGESFRLTGAARKAVEDLTGSSTETTSIEDHSPSDGWLEQMALSGPDTVIRPQGDDEVRIFRVSIEEVSTDE